MNKRYIDERIIEAKKHNQKVLRLMISVGEFASNHM